MSSVAPRILVVDDDPEIRKLLARYIESQGFRVALAANCAELRERLATAQIDLIVLDVMLPDGSGLEICRNLRAERSRIPIILLTALKEDVDRIIGLEIGADDYLGKPFNPRELIARVRAVLRRRGEVLPQANETKIYWFEGFTAHAEMELDLSHGGSVFDSVDSSFDVSGGRSMDSKEIHDYARRFVGAHGDKAELEAAQKAAECERQGQNDQAADWRKIQAAIKEMRGPHAS